ncbi:MAG TPA: iron-containing alcohol dehydrogenase [Deltaproteobacteria bacterium]|jgi:NADP-dependent alcohol dehydrogenase|nr:iron-containing alcohol dehydrogenase [Deltaproteobacteria bacterium]HPD20382.1 iron-containing alcohol dehydrogenase [Deltaproteobacteria bacterium]HRV34856.1 iron-containing alcohol dehydrogenase [Desulfomonilia bacterium]
MLNFKYHNPTKIIFGKGRIKDVAKEIPKGSRILITYGGGSVRRNGVLDQVMNALEGRDVLEFSGIEPNPEYDTLMKCVELARSERIDFILAVGGGSVIDGTKFIAAAVPYQGDTWEIATSFGRRIGGSLPFGTVLTLPATGSEMNSNAVISRCSLNAKLLFAHPSLFPVFSVLDPTTTYTLPPEQISNGIIDTFVHVTEQYLTYPVQGKIQDRFAEGLLLTLIEDGPVALREPENYDVRASLMWCATLGLNGLIGAGVPQDWATHMVGHELTALYGLDHGKTLAIVLPALLRARRNEKRDKLLQYAERVWGIVEGDDDARIEAAIEKTQAFFESLGVRTALSAYGISNECIPRVAELLEQHGLTRLGERSDITPDTVREVLELCL